MSTATTPSAHRITPRKNVTRSSALADRLLRGASALVALARTLTDAEWQLKTPDGRKIGVLVHHVATMYPLEIQLAQLLAAGKAVEGVTWAAVHQMNAQHAKDFDGVSKLAALELLERNSAAAEAAIRALTDEELDRAAAISLNADAPLTCQFMLEDHAVRHSFHHLVKIRETLQRASLDVAATTSGVGATSNWSEDALTARARTIWSGADFLPIARSFATGAEEFVARLALRSTETVLDLACGTGNLAIPAARTGAVVTGIDIAANLIAQARIEARAIDRPITFDVGDAESLPYDNGQFDTTITMFGAMFAYRPERAAAEMIRVTRPGGRIAMANWTPGSLIARMLAEHVKVAPPPAGIPSVLEWGKPEVVRERLGDRVRDLTCTPRPIALRFNFSPEAVTELFARCYGPTVMTLSAAKPEAASAFRAALTALFTSANAATDGTTTLIGEYLDVQAVVR